jgi:hypothetical protein
MREFSQLEFGNRRKRGGAEAPVPRVAARQNEALSGCARARC